MTNHTTEYTDPERDPLDRFVAFERRTGKHGHEWDQPRWFPDVKVPNSHAGKPSITFETRRTGPKDKAIPLTGRFGAFSRAVMSAANHGTERSTIEPLRMTMEALRFLHAAIGGNDPDPASVTRGTLDAAYEAMMISFTPQPANQRGSKLGGIAKLLDEYAICEPLDWEHTPQPLAPASGAGKKAKPLTVRQFGAVAALSNTELPDEEDRLAQCVVDLMFASGLRVGEAMTLPRNCLYCEEVEGPGGRMVARWGIWYWSEKVEAEDHALKPLPTAAVPIVMRALDRALALTDEAWKVARHQHLHGRTTLSAEWDDAPDSALMSNSDVGRILGVAGKGYIKRHRIPHEQVCDGRYVKLYVKKIDLLHHLWCKSVTGNCREDLNFHVGLHELLFVKHDNGLRGTARKIDYKAVHGYLNGNAYIASIFARKGMLEDGHPISISPHSFRTTHETIAIRGGMSDIHQARMAGRGTVSVNPSYDGRQDEEMGEALDEKLVEGGWSSAATLPEHVPMAPDEPLVRPGMAAHCTSLGVCHHPYAKAPCPMYVDLVGASFDDPGLAGDEADRLRLVEQIDRQREAAIAAGPDVLGAATHADLCAAAISALRSGPERSSLPRGRVGRGSRPRSRAGGDAR